MSDTVRERLLEGAIGLMAENGIAGTGVTELVERSQVSRRSVYLKFPAGKSELVAEATRTAGALMGATLEHLMAEDSPVPPITRFASLWADVLRTSGFAAGCPIVAAALGRREAPEAAGAAGEVYAGWVRSLADWAVLRGVEDEAAVALATTVVAAVEGAVIMSIAQESTLPLERTCAQLEAVVASLVG